MAHTESEEFILKSRSQRSRPLSVVFVRENGLADLTITAEGEQLFSGRVLGAFAGILKTVADMEETAGRAKRDNDMMKYFGCMFIARTGRTQIASRLNIPELAEYD